MPLVRHSIQTDPPPRPDIKDAGTSSNDTESLRMHTFQWLRCIDALAQLCHHASDIMHELQVQTSDTNTKSTSLNAKLQTQVTQSWLLNDYAKVPIQQSTNLPDVPISGFLTPHTRPDCIKRAYTKAQHPPNLQSLDIHHDGKFSCLQHYSHPGFFVDEWQKWMDKELDDRKQRKLKRKLLNQRLLARNNPTATASSLQPASPVPQPTETPVSCSATIAVPLQETSIATSTPAPSVTDVPPPANEPDFALLLPPPPPPPPPVFHQEIPVLLIDTLPTPVQSAVSSPVSPLPGPPPPPPPPMIDTPPLPPPPCLADLIVQAPKLKLHDDQPTDKIDNVLNSIKAGGFVLRKVVTAPVNDTGHLHKKQAATDQYGSGVAGILMRRAAIEMSDSDSDADDSDDDNDW